MWKRFWNPVIRTGLPILFLIAVVVALSAIFTDSPDSDQLLAVGAFLALTVSIIALPPFSKSIERAYLPSGSEGRQIKSFMRKFWIRQWLHSEAGKANTPKRLRLFAEFLDKYYTKDDATIIKDHLKNWEDKDNNTLSNLFDLLSLKHPFAQDSESERILLLGPSGSGKSLQLLELAEHLLSTSCDLKKPDVRVPLFLNLGSWAPRCQEFDLWLEEEISRQYQLPRWRASELVKHNYFILLLDDFHEVPTHQKTLLITALERFVEFRCEPYLSEKSDKFPNLEQMAIRRDAIVITSDYATDEDFDSFHYDLCERLRCVAVRLLPLQKATIADYLQKLLLKDNNYFKKYVGKILHDSNLLRAVDRPFYLVAVAELAQSEFDPEKLLSLPDTSKPLLPEDVSNKQRDELLKQYIEFLLKQLPPRISPGLVRPFAFPFRQWGQPIRRGMVHFAPSDMMKYLAKEIQYDDAGLITKHNVALMLLRSRLVVPDDLVGFRRSPTPSLAPGYRQQPTKQFRGMVALYTSVLFGVVSLLLVWSWAQYVHIEIASFVVLVSMIFGRVYGWVSYGETRIAWNYRSAIMSGLFMTTISTSLLILVFTSEFGLSGLFGRFFGQYGMSYVDTVSPFSWYTNETPFHWYVHEYTLLTKDAPQIISPAFEDCCSVIDASMDFLIHIVPHILLAFFFFAVIGGQTIETLAEKRRLRPEEESQFFVVATYDVPRKQDSKIAQ